MSEDTAGRDEGAAGATAEPSSAQPGKGTRIGATLVLALIAASLLWYFAADRLTPHSSQARVQAFVVPVAAEVSGKVLAVHVRNNDAVAAGQPLFDIDPSQYRIALQRSRSDYESVQRSVNASAATVEAARASLQAAQANHVKADKDATRQESLYAEDPGAISVRRLEVAQATRIQARSQEKAAEADLRKAQEAAGESGDNNAQLRSAGSAIEKAELDLARTKVVAPGRGVVTDLRTRCRPFRPGGRGGDDADRQPRPVDQRRPDREQPRQHRSWRRGGDHSRRTARRGTQRPCAQCRRWRQFRPAGAGRNAADDPEQPRLAAPGAALPGGDRIRRCRSGAGWAGPAPVARPR
jgi:hypothetical protein